MPMQYIYAWVVNSLQNQPLCTMKNAMWNFFIDAYGENDMFSHLRLRPAVANGSRIPIIHIHNNNFTYKL